MNLLHEHHLVEVEDEIQLTYIAKVSVKHLNKVVHQLQCDQLIVAAVNAHYKVKAGIPLIHHLRSTQNYHDEDRHACW